MKILACGFFPALQRTVELCTLQIGGVNRAESVSSTVGGKATNSARVLKRLGVEHRLLSFCGGHIGSFIRDLLRQEGISCDCIETENESRICQTILAGCGGDFTEVIEDAAVPSPQEWEALLRRFGEMQAGFDFIILSGTLRPEMPVDIYARLISLTDPAKVLLDTSGEPLLSALEERPAMVKINADELALTLGGEGDTVVLAEELARQGRCAVGITLGGQGAVLVSAEGALHYPAPKVDMVSALGCGDSVNAGTVAALGRGLRLKDAFAYGLACGTANAETALPGVIDPGAVDKYYRQISDASFQQ